MKDKGELVNINIIFLNVKMLNFKTTLFRALLATQISAGV